MCNYLENAAPCIGFTHGGGSEKSYYRTDVRAHRSRCRRPVDVAFLFPEVSTLKSGRLFFSFFSPPRRGSRRWRIWRRGRHTVETFSRCRRPSLRGVFFVRYPFELFSCKGLFYLVFSPKKFTSRIRPLCVCVPGSTERFRLHAFISR